MKYLSLVIALKGGGSEKGGQVYLGRMSSGLEALSTSLDFIQCTKGIQ